MRSPSVEPFEVPLPIPPILKPVRTDAGSDYYEMTERVGRQGILPGLKTELWGYEGIFPGPIIEARSGRRVEIRQWNELPVPVSTHLHGAKTPPASCFTLARLTNLMASTRRSVYGQGVSRLLRQTR